MRYEHTVTAKCDGCPATAPTTRRVRVMPQGEAAQVTIPKGWVATVVTPTIIAKRDDASLLDSAQDVANASGRPVPGVLCVRCMETRRASDSVLIDTAVRT